MASASSNEPRAEARAAGDRLPVTRSVGSVVIAVITYRRNDDLATLLPQLQLHAAEVAAARVDLLVIDNDPDGGAAPVVADVGGPGVRYVHEPSPGIAAARNRALREAADHDVLVFIDDDERPREGWLASLLDVFTSTECVGVVGPVVSIFERDLDPWIVAGGFFDRRRLPSGTVTDVAATNNLLLDLHVIRDRGVTFDERFGITGGSDTLFTRTLCAGGYRLVWCDEAVVTDVVPAARCTRDWVLRRRLRIGTSRSRTELALAATPRGRAVARLRMAGAGAVRLVQGSTRMARGWVLGDIVLRAGGARLATWGIGVLGGACGYAYAEYRREPRARQRRS